MKSTKRIILTAGLTLVGGAVSLQLIAQDDRPPVDKKANSPTLDRGAQMTPTPVPGTRGAIERGTIQQANQLKSVRVEFESDQTALNRAATLKIDREVRAVGADNILSVHVVAWADSAEEETRRGTDRTAAQPDGTRATAPEEDQARQIDVASARADAVKRYLTSTHGINNVETFNMAEGHNMYSAPTTPDQVGDAAGAGDVMDTRRLQSVRANKGDSVALVLIEARDRAAAGPDRLGE